MMFHPFHHLAFLFNTFSTFVLTGPLVNRVVLQNLMVDSYLRDSIPKY